MEFCLGIWNLPPFFLAAGFASGLPGECSGWSSSETKCEHEQCVRVSVGASITALLLRRAATIDVALQLRLGVFSLTTNMGTESLDLVLVASLPTWYV